MFCFYRTLTWVANTVVTIGVPFGLAIIQTADREDLLVRYGSAIEDLMPSRPKPEFRNVDADNYMYVG